MDSFSCSIFPSCPGCKIQTNVTSPPILDRINRFFEKKIPLIYGDIVEWRSKVKLAVRGTIDCPEIGLFAENSHSVVPMTKCPLHYAAMDKALSVIYKAISAYQIEPYLEKTNQGRLRYLQMVFDRKTEKVQLSLIFNAESLRENEIAFVKQLYNSLPFWHSIWVNFVSGPTNTILGSRWELFQGEEDFWQEILGIPFYFHPSSFSQAHLGVFEEMLKEIALYLPEKANLLELYAGVGCISLSLASKASFLTLVESSPLSLFCFRKTLSRMNSEISSKSLFFLEPVEEASFPEEVDVILVDPPRKGLSKKCKEKIFASKATQCVYVSCGPDSCLRDCKDFEAAGWFVDDVKAFLFFPGQDHVELLVNLKRAAIS